MSLQSRLIALAQAVGTDIKALNAKITTVVTTLDWNTALAPNFYRSSDDPMLQTAHSPGDAINPPRTAGIVTAHESGALVQRVWDLDYLMGYTRYRGSDGTWSAWVSEVTKPPVFIDQMVGGATPQDGDERYFQNAAMKALGIVWKFRYNKTSSSAYKWEFVGGSSWLVTTEAEFTALAAGVQDMSGGPSIALPLMGDYKLDYGALINPVNNGWGAGVFPVATNLAANTGISAVHNPTNMSSGFSNSASMSVHRSYGATGISGTLKLQCWCGLAGSKFSQRNLIATPIRVGM